MISGKQLEKQTIPGMSPEVKQVDLNLGQAPQRLITNLDVQDDEVPLFMNQQSQSPYAAFGFGYNNAPAGLGFIKNN